MNDLSKKPSWVGAIGDAAKEVQIQLPAFIDRGMGSAICRSTDGARFVSVKRRFVDRKSVV